jgi:hypothetical protein
MTICDSHCARRLRPSPKRRCSRRSGHRHFGPIFGDEQDMDPEQFLFLWGFKFTALRWSATEESRLYTPSPVFQFSHFLMLFPLLYNPFHASLWFGRFLPAVHFPGDFSSSWFVSGAASAGVFGCAHTSAAAACGRRGPGHACCSRCEWTADARGRGAFFERREVHDG